MHLQSFYVCLSQDCLPTNFKRLVPGLLHCQPMCGSHHTLNKTNIHDKAELLIKKGRDTLKPFEYFNSSMKRTEYGFTLVEILVVVGIIALLVAFIAPNLFSAQARSTEKICKSKASVLDRAIVDYKLEKGTAPDASNFNGLISELIAAKVLDDNEDNQKLTEENKCGNGTFEYKDGHIIWTLNSTTP